MENLNDYHQNIVELASKRYNYEEKDLFFEKYFQNYNINDQAAVLSEFQKDFTFFVRYINGSINKEKLEKLFEDSSYNFATKEIDYDDIFLFPILLSYFNMDYVSFNSDLYDKVFNKIEELYKFIDLRKAPFFEDVLSSYLKNVIYASSDNDDYKQMVDSDSYSSFERIICKYIDSMNENELVKSELLQLIVESSVLLPNSIIGEKIKDKVGDNVSFNKYLEYINLSKKIPYDLEHEFIDCLKKYRLLNGMLPLDVCYYINYVYSDRNDLLRLCNIDLIRDYLLKNDVNDATAIYDEDIVRFNSLGIALPTVLALKDVSLSSVMFHEATHLMQYRNFKYGKDYSGNNYDMLKDFVLKDFLPEIVYNRNHNRYLFEIEADYHGEYEYYKALEKIGDLTEKDRFREEKLMDNKWFRLSMAHFLNLNGEDYEKGQLFDDIILEHPEIISKYPILNIEYYNNGQRKDVIDILEALDQEAAFRNEDEITSITNCIFGEYYVVDDAIEMLKTLKEYVPKHSYILDSEKRLIDELMSMNIDSDDGLNKKRKNS